MKIQHVVSYLNAWQKLNRDNSKELDEIIRAADSYYNGRVQLNKSEDNYSRNYWEKALFDLNWKVNDQVHYTPSGRRIQLGSLGPLKNGISAQTTFANPSWFHRWLFSQGTLAVRYAMVKIPVIVAPMKAYEPANISGVPNRLSGTFGTFEYLKDQLETIAPLSSNFPFLLLGLSDASQLFDPEVTELASDPNITTEKIVIDRCIEFSPEYHQAGLGILNFFGTFLRENYPDRDAKVRIEQHELSVRLTVETTDGNTETIEKAFRDYQLVISGKVKPEMLSMSDRAVLELKTELRIAQVRIESQQDIIGIQNGRLDKMLDVLGSSLEAAHMRPVVIQNNPSFHNTNSLTLNPNVAEAIADIQDLLDSLPPSDETRTVLSDLSGSLEAIETEKDPEKLKVSPGLTKLGRFLRRVADGNEALEKSISNIERGQEIVGSLAKSYNKIASLCGLPNIPFI